MIAPVIQFVASAKDATTITLKDSTGAYNSTTNPGGYGTPNAAAPTIVGMRLRWWGSETFYGNLLTASPPVLAGLLGDGYPFTTNAFSLGDGAFQTGVHQVLYYPFETVDTVVTLTAGSKLVTITGGTAIDVWSAAYKAIGALNAGSPTGKVYLIDYTQPITSSTFYLTEAWAGNTTTGVAIVRATESDMKVLIYQHAQRCVVQGIGKMALNVCGCEPKTVSDLMQLTMFIFSAQADFECTDYQGAHNKLVYVYTKCNDCNTTCKSCN